MDEHDAATSTLLEGSQLTQKGRADVFRQRERTKRKKILRAIVLLLLVDAYLFRRIITDHPFQLPKPNGEWIIFLPAILLVFAVLLMVAMPLMNGKSPHVTVHPEQVEVGLTEVKGLDNQVEELVRTLDVFLGYATFREELGGTPRRGILFEGPPGTGKTYLAKAMSKQAGVPFLFIAAPALQSMWFGMTAYRIRSFFKALRKAARKEGGAIGFIEEIDAIGMSRDGLSAMTPANEQATPAPGWFGRTVAPMVSSGNGGMVNELLIQMQSFDQAPWRDRMRAKLVGFGQRIPAHRPSVQDGQAPLPQHPPHRGDQPRRLSRPCTLASRPLRSPPLLRPAHQVRARGAARLLPPAQEASRAAGRAEAPRASRARDVRLYPGHDRAPAGRGPPDGAPRRAARDELSGSHGGQVHGGDRQQATHRVHRRRPRVRRHARGGARHRRLLPREGPAP